MSITERAWDVVAGAPRRRRSAARRGALILVTVAALTVVCALAPISGLTNPRLFSRVTRISIDAAHHAYSYRIVLENHGFFDETIRRIDSREPRFNRVERVSPTVVSVPAGGRTTITLTFVIPRCADAGNASPDSIVRLDRFWGVESTALDLPRVAGGIDGLEGSPAFTSQGGQRLFMDGPAVLACGGGSP